MSEDRVRVLRVLEYEGPRSWVESSLEARAVKGQHTLPMAPGRCIIREAIIGTFPEVLERWDDGSTKA